MQKSILAIVSYSKLQKGYAYMKISSIRFQKQKGNLADQMKIIDWRASKALQNI